MSALKEEYLKYAKNVLNSYKTVNSTIKHKLHKKLLFAPKDKCRICNTSDNIIINLCERCFINAKANNAGLYLESKNNKLIDKDELKNVLQTMLESGDIHFNRINANKLLKNIENDEYLKKTGCNAEKIIVLN